MVNSAEGCLVSKTECLDLVSGLGLMELVPFRIRLEPPFSGLLHVDCATYLAHFHRSPCVNFYVLLERLQYFTAQSMSYLRATCLIPSFLETLGHSIYHRLEHEGCQLYSQLFILLLILYWWNYQGERKYRMINSLRTASSLWNKSFPENIFPTTFYDMKENNTTYTSCDCVEFLLSQSPRWYLPMISQNFAQIIPKWPSVA